MAQWEQVAAELSAGDVARRSGVAISAIHFYERKGLIESRRTGGNQRRYGRDILRRVAVIKVAQRLGLTLADIRAALGTLPSGRTPTRGDWEGLSRHWRSSLDDRIEMLIRLRDELDTCIGCGCLSLADCPLRNPWDELGADGPGPRLLEANGIKSAT